MCFIHTAASWIPHDYDKIPVERAALQSPVLDAVILRLGMIYGENDPNRRFSVPIQKMASGEKSIKIAKGMASFCASKCYVENVAHGIALAVARGQTGEIYNLADKQVLTELEWLELLAKKLNWPGEIITVGEETPGIAFAVSVSGFVVTTFRGVNRLTQREKSNTISIE